MDYMSGLLSTKHGNDYVFVVIDRFSKMVILTTCKKNVTTTETAKLFFERVWVHFGIPQTIISDQDNRFLNTFWSSLWSLLDTKLTKSTSFHPQTDGQTEVVNRMIVHILCMYNSKHPRTWDESLPYVPLGPIDVALPLATTQQTLPLISLRSTKPPDSLSGFNTSANRSRRFCRNPMLSTSSAMINTGYHTSFRLATKSGYICRRSISPGPIKSFTHSVMGLTLSPRLWVAMLLSSTLHPSLVCIQYSMWTSFGHIFHHYWTPLRLSNN
jgi:hypothetical protein